MDQNGKAARIHRLEQHLLDAVGIDARAGLLLLSLFLLATAWAASGAPDIIYIVADDLGWGDAGCYGGEVRTPNLDALASESVRFDRAYVNSPVCSASRQSILTGQLPHAAGVTLLFTPFSVEKVTIADHLKERGFRTAAIGKMHFNSFKEALRRWGYEEDVVAQADDHHGFDLRIDVGDYRRQLRANPPREIPPEVAARGERGTFDDPAYFWNADVLPAPVYEEDSEAYYFADQAIDFLRSNGTDRFCLWLSFREPHTPFSFPVEYADAFDPADMVLPPVSPEDERWIPEVFADLTDAEKRGIAAAYHASVEHLDRNIGRVLDALEEEGLADETLVIYVGDHGYLLGHHGRFEKHSMWEEAVRAPLLMKNVPRFGTGRSTDALVEFIDLVPTILDVLEMPPMPSAHGRSLIPMLDSAVDHHRNHVFIEYLVDDMAMVRTRQWKYIFTAGRHDLALGYATGNPPPGPTELLYDLEADPREGTNLASSSEHRRVLEAMRELMLHRFRSSHPEALELPEGLTDLEELAWFTRPRDPVGPDAPVQ